MKVHTNNLLGEDMKRALPDGVYISEFKPSRYNSRSHARAFDVRLSGSSKYNQSGTSHKAATYDEWGHWLSVLFDYEPAMKAGHYINRDDFHAKTEGRFSV